MGKNKRFILADNVNGSIFSSKLRLLYIGVFALLTFLILVFQTNYVFNQAAIQSVGIINNFNFFTVLFLMWFILFIGLIFTHPIEKNDKLEKAFLLCVFSLVLPLFWKISAYNSIPAFNGGTFVGQLLAISTQGHTVGSILTSVDYAALYPAQFLDAQALSVATGLDAFTLVHLFEIVTFLALIIIIFVTFTRYTQSTTLGAFSVVILVLCNQLLSTWYITYAYYGLIFLALFLFLLSFKAQRYVDILLILVVLAATITHFMTSILLVLILAGLFFIGVLYNKKWVNKRVLILSICVLIIWVVYVSWYQVFGTAVHHLLDYESFTGFYIGQLVNANAAVAPMWANLTQFSWLAIVYGVGSLLALSIFVFRKRLKSDELTLLYASIFLATLIMSLAAILISSNGVQFNRLLLYIPFLTIPIMIRFCKFRRKLLFSLIILSLILSFPSFLLVGRSISNNSWYTYEITSVSFMNGKTNYVYTGAGTIDAVLMMSQAWNISYSSLPEANSLDSEKVINKTNALLLSFLTTQDQNSIFYLSPRTFTEYIRLSSVNSTELNSVLNQLSNCSRIYDNNYVTFYSP